jgi:hypothetical protein
LTVNSEYDANGKVGLDNATVKFTVKNDLSQQIPEFPVWTLLVVTAAALVAVIGVYRRRLTTSNGETSQ